MKTKVISGGGLGNQLFSWAFAHYYKRATGKEIEIILSKNSFPKYYSSISVMESFCNHSIATRHFRMLSYLLHIVDWLKFKFTFVKNNTNFFLYYESNEVWELPSNSSMKNLVFRGFFQNFELIEQVGFQIFSEINDVNNCVLAKLEKLRQIINSDYQFIHIRRGDYVNNREHYGLLNFSYYRANMEKDIFTFVSCDDSDFEAQIRSEFPEAFFLSPNEFDVWTVFAIMSKAKILLMANSSLSWWAGNLVVENGGIAIMPTPWFQAMPEITNYLVNPKFKPASAIFVS